MILLFQAMKMESPFENTPTLYRILACILLCLSLFASETQPQHTLAVASNAPELQQHEPSRNTHRVRFPNKQIYRRSNSARSTALSLTTIYFVR